MNDVIMSDADCTPSREPRSLASSKNKKNWNIIFVVYNNVFVMQYVLSNGHSANQPMQ